MVIQYDKNKSNVIKEIPKKPEIILDGYRYLKKCVLEENANDEEILEIPKIRSKRKILGRKLKSE